MYNTFFMILILLPVGRGWRAIPVNQASFSQRRQLALPKHENENVLGDEYLPRNSLHSVYKFGWCRPDAMSKVYLRKTASVQFTTWQSTQAAYVYLIQYKHTQRFRLQCVVMRIMVPSKHMWRRSRLPIYYCQGIAYYVMFNMVQKLEVHEMFLHSFLNMPADLFFEFYHPPTYDTHVKELYHGPVM